MRSVILAFSFLLAGISSAKAEPISATIALITAFTSWIGAGVSAFGVSLFGATAWAGLTGFLASPIGSLLVGVGLSLVSSLFVQKPGRKQQVPTIEAGKVNVRVGEPERWICAGEVRQGGAVVFAEFDAIGNFWYVMVHSDSILTEIVKRFFDDNELTMAEDGANVISPDFCLSPDYQLVDEDDDITKIPWYRTFTTTYTTADPVPPPLTLLTENFSGVWTLDHKLAGTTYSLVRVEGIPPEHRHKMYRWRGAIGIGEPSFAIVGNWSTVYDPRDEEQVLGDPSTYKFSRNSVLIWAWFRTHRYGRGKSESSINWDRVAEQADICDQIVSGISGDQPRYQCGIAIPESKERVQAEAEILLSCDGQLVFDDDGTCWVRVGYWYAPELFLSRNRDIVGMETVEAQNGESETQGVIVRYIDPDAKYMAQPSAPWINPYYFVEGETPKFLVVDALAIQNHNQAMRLAKSIGLRSQPPHKILPTTGLRGIKARQERIVNIQYDNTFSGNYEIVTPVEIDELGVFCGFGAIPIDANRFDLLPGEELSQPVLSETDTTVPLELPTGVLLQFANNRIEAYFDEPPRLDWRYVFQYQPISEDPETGLWSDMLVKMDELFAYSGTVDVNTDYRVRFRTVSSSGRANHWIDPIPTVNTGVIELSGTPVTTATKDDPYTGFTITVAGGISPYYFLDLYSRLPPGITIDSETGDVSGVPTVAGIFANIIIRVSDSNGALRNFSPFTITVAP